MSRTERMVMQGQPESWRRWINAKRWISLVGSAAVQVEQNLQMEPAKLRPMLWHGAKGRFVTQRDGIPLLESEKLANCCWAPSMKRRDDLSAAQMVALVSLALADLGTFGLGGERVIGSVWKLLHSHTVSHAANPPYCQWPFVLCGLPLGKPPEVCRWLIISLPKAWAWMRRSWRSDACVQFPTEFARK